MDNRKKEWNIYQKAEKEALKWSKINGIKVFRYHFIDQENNPSEVFIFYETDKDILLYEESGVTGEIEKIFSSHFLRLKKEGITFIVDSDENIKKNYKGNYFYRFR